jgi:hypothetical protein
MNPLPIIKIKKPKINEDNGLCIGNGCNIEPNYARFGGNWQLLMTYDYIKLHGKVRVRRYLFNQNLIFYKAAN